MHVFALVPVFDLKVAQDDEVGWAGIVLKPGPTGADLPFTDQFGNGTRRRDQSIAELVAPFRWRSQYPMTGGALSIITLFWGDWIEFVFRVDPDRHIGSMEWLIVAALLAASLVAAFLAVTEWRMAVGAAS